MAINYDPSTHGGAAFGDKDYDHLKKQGHSDAEINKYIKGLQGSSVSNKYKGGTNQYSGSSNNEAWQKERSKQEAAGKLPWQIAKAKAQSQQSNRDDDSERLSSEGLYQDKYAVGYHGADDLGSDYVSTGDLGSILNYFKDADGNRRTNEQGIEAWINQGGYAGDILKKIDSGWNKNFKNWEYNWLVNEAKNEDWDARAQKYAKYNDGNAYDVRQGGTIYNSTDKGFGEQIIREGWNKGSQADSYNKRLNQLEAKTGIKFEGFTDAQRQQGGAQLPQESGSSSDEGSQLSYTDLASGGSTPTFEINSENSAGDNTPAKNRMAGDYFAL